MSDQPVEVMEGQSTDPCSSHLDLARDLAQNMSHFGLQIADVAGVLQDASAHSASTSKTFQSFQASIDRVQSINEQIATAVQETRAQSDASIEESRQARSQVNTAVDTIATLSQAVGDISSQLQDLQNALTGVRSFSDVIDGIARQTNLLALNATIEAARAGEAGRGFAVVASEVKALAQQTSQATEKIAETIASLDEETGSLIGVCDEAVSQVSAVKDTTEAVQNVMVSLEETMGQLQSSSSDISSRVDENSRTLSDFSGEVRTLDSQLTADAASLSKASEEAVGAVRSADSLISSTAVDGIETLDARMLGCAERTAAQIGQLFEDAIASGTISEHDLFDFTYTPVPGTNPEQVMTKFTELTDRLLPDVQEPLLQQHDAMVFCAAVDRNGYLPTHNLVFSQKQGSDPVWNASHCRNRRIFNDPVGLGAGKNASGRQLQTYRRDMGGGKFVLMKDASCTIRVNGRHWGGFRIGYK
ncbi:methyl-accepting chemotaxis protein [Coralliovum pocilloporae]|uniref:methyl-accepting chemotaxis protein n=1 Tax=Coralliovum pocilloporae TaxID=3066369 RepID=UPI003307B250